ncbi:FAD-dependent oxidoreductase [Longibacter salinarum]|uniref:FAD-dependent oxidoreductase n=1 Tax=Longibacter salinarum TaxID=1850348 RepID=A0A2A8CZF3_9BACT|nr:FAD-dependent oxidoreductase [Longibacter salinarum]PEN14092.1 FAD-dependent oxidoreductase [Longibacter salinarum]
MTVSIWQQAQRRRAVAYDVAVVGGGIVGCSTAYWLRQRDPSLRVAIVDANSLGAGASGRNAGFVLLGTHEDYLSAIREYGERTAHRLWQFTRENRRLISELDGSTFGWREKGSLTVAGDEEEDDRLRRALPYMRAAGIPVVYLGPSETMERLHAQGFHGSLYCTTGAAVDPLRLVRYLAAESGADALTHHRVTKLHSEGGGVVLDTPRLQVKAERAVLAAGAYVPQIVPSLQQYVRPVRAQMLATHPAPDQLLSSPVYSHDGYFYARQLDGGTILAGGGRYQHRETEVGYEDATTPAVQADIERYLHTHFPWTTNLRIESRWSGTMGFSPDNRPVVGRVPNCPSCLYATGFTGHGMGYGVRMGQMLADTLVQDEPPKSYKLFTAERFQSKPSVPE